MDLVWGLLIGLGTVVSSHVLGFDRDRSYYPTLMIIIALAYILFAVIAVPPASLLLEGAAAAVFVGLAVAGHRWNLWLVVVALLGHGVFDLIHPRLIANAGVPVWYAGFCSVADLILAAALAMLILRGHVARRIAAPAA